MGAQKYSVLMENSTKDNSARMCQQVAIVLPVITQSLLPTTSIIFHSIMNHFDTAENKTIIITTAAT